jgi:hypothetical protein
MNFRTENHATKPVRSDPSLDAAGAQEAPAGSRLKNSEQARHNQDQAPQRMIANDDAGDEAQRADHPARHAPAVIQVWMKKLLHVTNLACHVPKTKFIAQEMLVSHGRLRHNGMIVNWFNENFLLASLFWGSIAGGYLIYGWKQKALMPFLGGLVMTTASFLISSAALMSLACIAVMGIVYWLVKQGY